MTLDELENSVTSQTQPPAGLSLPLQALWYDKKGDWQKAHELAQQAGDRDGSWVHAYLHRKEGDIANARYWYRQAGRPESKDSLEKEWQELASALL